MPKTSSPSTSFSFPPSPSVSSSSSSSSGSDRRELLHLNVTDHPTAVWTARQILEAFPNETAPRYLLRDRDAVYGECFTRCLANMGIREVIIAPRAPRQNPFVERVIGSIRRECLDHFMILNEAHLRRLLRAYLAYYNTVRPHQALANNCPRPRNVQPPAARAGGGDPAGRRAPSPLPARGLIAVGRSNKPALLRVRHPAACGKSDRRTSWPRRRSCVAIPVAAPRGRRKSTPPHRASEDREGRGSMMFLTRTALRCPGPAVRTSSRTDCTTTPTRTPGPMTCRS